MKISLYGMRVYFVSQGLKQYFSDFKSSDVNVAEAVILEETELGWKKTTPIGNRLFIVVPYSMDKEIYFI